MSAQERLNAKLHEALGALLPELVAAIVEADETDVDAIRLPNLTGWALVYAVEDVDPAEPSNDAWLNLAHAPGQRQHVTTGLIYRFLD